MKRRTQQVGEQQAGLPLVIFVSTWLGLPPSEAQRLVDAGAVYVDGRRSRLSSPPLKAGQMVLAVLEESGRSTLLPSAPPPLEVLFEDDWLLAVNKSAGVTAQPTEGRVGESLLDAANARLGGSAGLVHRLDRDTSGVTVFAKGGGALTAMAEQFRMGTAKKRYLAAAGPGLGEAGEIDLPISKDPSRPGRHRATSSAHGKPAQTSYRRLFKANDFCLVELLPRTGRTHQLRAHLTALGAPILGDRLYGGAPRAAGISADRCLLHARSLLIRHPGTDEPILLEAPVPEDLLAFFTLAGVVPPGGAW